MGHGEGDLPAVLAAHPGVLHQRIHEESYDDALYDIQDAFYRGFTDKPAEKLGTYNQEQQATIIEHMYTGRERKKDEPLSSMEKKAKEIMEKTPEFPNAKALE
ncbi:MAG TPA: hypothetical protein VFL83_16740 [Anaeromyxobacter sp.]|nr:hypothetical protein [Anaeromyxobacter sp.]